MSKNLVLARVGRGSLHSEWIDGDRPRDWDLHVLPFEDLGDHGGSADVVHDVVPGPKWAGLRHLLNSWDGWRAYDHVWMPDDDIAADQGTITRMFAIAEAMGLDLWAPALHERSFYAHFSTMRNPRFHGRWAGFVEIMVPGFRTTALDRLLPTLDLSRTGWGWGLDSLWPKLLDYRNTGVIDATPVLHTRPVGEMRDAELAARVRRESDDIFATQDCRMVHATFGAFGADLRPLDLTPEALLADLVAGWDYLIARDARVLAWIMAYQQPHFPWPDYPQAGTPEISRALELAR